MLRFIDNLINKTTMYRLLLYYLIGLLLVAVILGFFKIVPYDPINILFSASLIVLVCFFTNFIFAKVFRAITNVESFLITALILVFLITPPTSLLDFSFLSLAIWASAIAMASKFIFTIRKKHIFNPVAIAVVITALFLNQPASWWIGTLPMMPFVLVGGLLLVRKIRRFDLVISFFVVALVGIVAGHYSGISSIFGTLKEMIFYSPILFFAFVMLTEPLTTPPTRFLRILYGTFVGLLFFPSVHIGSTYFTPELALIFGNIFSYLVSPKQKLFLILKEKIEIADGVYEFIFSKSKRFKFKAGQYLEWTVPGKNADSHGNRRYFTIASSPTEKNIKIGVKFYPTSSSFKEHLLDLPIGGQVVASQLSGDFTLPKNKNKKLVFIAGGIGITPFRSMIRYLIDTGEARDIVLLYSNKKEADIAYKNIFDYAGQEIGVRTIYALTDKDSTPDYSRGISGRITEETIKKEIPDYMERKFYISGPPKMIYGFQKTLSDLGIHHSHIKKDFFEGFV